MCASYGLESGWLTGSSEARLHAWKVAWVIEGTTDQESKRVRVRPEV